VRFYFLAYPDRKVLRVFELKGEKYQKIFEGASGTFTSVLCKD